MKKIKRLRLFPAYCDRLLALITLILVLFGLGMIVSADMSKAVGDNKIIITSLIKQVGYVLFGLIVMNIVMRANFFKLPFRFFHYCVYFVAFLLFVPRLFSPLGGAYAWIHFGGFTFQPSEFAKVFVIIYFSYILSQDKGGISNGKNFIHLLIVLGLYSVIILFVEKDFGSAIVLFTIGYLMLMTSSLPSSECNSYRRYMFYGFLFAIVISLIILSPIGLAFFAKMHSYKAARFLASANPFKDPYDTGYHLIMSLVSFANGGLFGLGYGNSIHKYMNFANPSSDFILPIIVEELGFVFGILPLIVLYGVLFIKLIYYSYKVENTLARTLLIGVFSYFALHFVLNVGGVSGILPLTGVPLLMISSGGSATVASLISLGLAQQQIIAYRKRKSEQCVL